MDVNKHSCNNLSNKCLYPEHMRDIRQCLSYFCFNDENLCQKKKKKKLNGPPVSLGSLFQRDFSLSWSERQGGESSSAMACYLHGSRQEAETTSPKPEKDAIVKAARLHFLMGPEPSI